MFVHRPPPYRSAQTLLTIELNPANARAAYEENTMVILPTALGKTVISALVAAEILYNYRKSRILVMAPTRPLVAQHARARAR